MVPAIGKPIHESSPTVVLLRGIESIKKPTGRDNLGVIYN